MGRGFAGASRIEQDIWYNQRLVCLAELNRWDLILDDTVEQIGDDDVPSDPPDLQRLWEQAVREPYLGLFMRGAVKVATYRSKAASFVQDSLEEPSKRDFLMKQYGSQLAHLAVVNDQLDRARFLLSNCYRQLRKQWSALHPLAVGARQRQLQKLQTIVELDEFVDLMAGRQLTEIPRSNCRRQWRQLSCSKTKLKNVAQLNFPNLISAPNTLGSDFYRSVDVVHLLILNVSSTKWTWCSPNRKLQEWRHRWPSSREDGVEVWDDIVQNRLVFFHKFQGLVNNQSNSGKDDIQTTFATKLDEERAHIFSQAASSLTKQGAYSVAEVRSAEIFCPRNAILF